MADRTLAVAICYPICSECSAVFVARNRGQATRQVCSTRCRAARNRRQLSPAAMAHRREQHRQYRSANLDKWAYSNRADAQRRHDAKRRQRRYARRRGASINGADFTINDVAERDKWRCGLCGEPVLRHVRFPNPRSRSLDHVLPISKGGSHELANVQLAHLGCNASKGNRVITFVGDHLPPA